ncbi:phospholipase D-like domain-containing protein [Puia sp.]|jgi:cardiolipin synthase|uniref:phospholipase D-like domain-containing protein n=1 Tax=Puia sp. TaxID=2045100 RepID=UPI002F4126A6
MARKKTARLLKGYTHHNKVRLVHGGKDYFEMIVRLIDGAQKTIHLQTYIFDGDETGLMVSDALLRAAARKVEINVLLDGYASQGLSREIIGQWKSAGIRFRWFWPLLKAKKFYLGRRLHHKVIVVDAARGMAGGVNISDRYNDIGDVKAWLDRALFVEGQAALKLHIICRDMWTRAYWKTTNPKKDEFTWVPAFVPDAECLVRVRRNDWVQGKNEISRSYVEMFRQARSHIIVLSAYFLPGAILRKQMTQAARRGVAIRIIVGGVSDVPISRLAEQYMYRWLFRNRIRVFEYQDTVLHGKMATYDGAWVTGGSYNVNQISAYASVELNLDVRNEKFASCVEQELESLIRDHCKEIIAEEYFQHTGHLRRLLQWGAYETVRVLFFLFTFYWRQERETGSARRL